MEKETYQIIKSPGIGNKGEPIKIRANFFEVTKIPKMRITHYDITISPEVPPRLNRKVFERFSKDNQDALGGVKPVYDGTYSIKKNNIFRNK
ncbi:MAG: hypothetical protein I3270_02320 [Candidatus Moeniiplasma glomeromycotorum]|nr:hypothetical protein [Candidatus Moeniiplasma glomeromycotorum]